MRMDQLQNLKDLVDFSAETYGEKTAIRYKKKKEIIDRSYLDLNGTARRLAGHCCREISAESMWRCWGLQAMSGLLPILER